MRIAIPSVNYGDLLAVTLPAWLGIVAPEQLMVVTSPEDGETRALAKRHCVRAFVTDAWTRTDPTCHVNGRLGRVMARWRRGRKDATPTFNLALALDEAFGFLDPVDRGVCAVADADCYPIGELPPDDGIHAGTIYGAMRYHVPTPHHLADVLNGTRALETLRRMVASGRIVRSQHRDVPNVGEGYFQLFRHVAGLRFGSYPAADEYDYDFALRFQRGVLLPLLSMLHLGENAANWDGRVTARWGAA